MAWRTRMWEMTWGSRDGEHGDDMEDTGLWEMVWGPPQGHEIMKSWGHHSTVEGQSGEMKPWGHRGDTKAWGHHGKMKP